MKQVFDIGTNRLENQVALLISLKVETFEPNKLPSDLAKIPAVKPGSK